MIEKPTSLSRQSEKIQNSDYYPLNKGVSTFLLEGCLYKETQNSFINVPVDYFCDEVGGLFPNTETLHYRILYHNGV